MSNEALREQIEAIASRFQMFECLQCSAKIQTFLQNRCISYKVIRLLTGNSEDPFGNIYHEGLQQNIATNGQHEGISVIIEETELIFDNIHHQGIPRSIWLNNFYCPIQDFGGDFLIEEIEF